MESLSGHGKGWFLAMIESDKSVTEKFRLLVDWGILAPEKLNSAKYAGGSQNIEIERILITDHKVPRRKLLQAISNYYQLPFIEYDERMPVPPELLTGLDRDMLLKSLWFPIIRDGETVVIATNDPQDPAIRDEIRNVITATRYEFRVALGEDITWFIRDFLNEKPGNIIGTERTGLAFWRNTMAQWRTRLACYRNDLAKGRTSLAFLRLGLGIIAIANTLMHTQRILSKYSYWSMITMGILVSVFGLYGYLKIRKSRMKPPRHQTLVEVTAATMYFLENYHFIDNTPITFEKKETMLARLGDFLANHCTVTYPTPASRERIHLARERNVLAAQRTVASCYRTIYARARTGLSFMRTGIVFSTLGLGLMHYFGLSLLTFFDSMLVMAGIIMVADGILWYLPVRKEQSEIPRCPVPE
jgi:uncharacterized membrane protein YidH (DUF202 family)